MNNRICFHSTAEILGVEKGASWNLAHGMFFGENGP